MRILVVVLAIGLLSGCTDGVDPRRLNGDAAVASPSPAPSTEGVPETQPPQPDVDVPRDGQPDPRSDVACDDRAFAGIAGAIGGQLDAFAVDDFALALTFATPDFRQAFDAQTFESMIVGEFPIAAGAQSHEVTGCAEDGAVASALVDVVASAGTQTFQYLLEEVDGVWLIGGAIPLTTDDGVTGEVI